MKSRIRGIKNNRTAQIHHLYWMHVFHSFIIAHSEWFRKRKLIRLSDIPKTIERCVKSRSRYSSLIKVHEKYPGGSAFTM